MSNLDPEFIERYQRMYAADPRSQVFALLGDAYRKIGKLDQALTVIKEGLKYHPNMASAHLVLGRIYLDRREVQKSLGPLQEATRMAPENILAHQYLAESYLKLKRPKDALNAYKLIMLINPTDAIATTAIKKLESLTADEYSADLFAMIHPSHRTTPKTIETEEKNPESTETSLSMTRTLDRTLSLADALAARNDIEKAIQVLESGKNELGNQPEILRRIKLLANLGESATESPTPVLNPNSRHAIANSSKKELLMKLLKQVQSRRRHARDIGF
jgi:tetratricopeptide (TPR) repeat protein